MRDWKLLLATAVAVGTGLFLMRDTLLGSLYPLHIRSLIELTRSEGIYQPEEPQETFPVDEYDSLIVIPDIHGDSDHFVRCVWLGLTQVNGFAIEYSDLETLILVAATRGEYPRAPLLTNSKTAMIQIGDLVDRGPQSILCLRILWVIEKVVGWKVVSLLGNHEIMSSTGIHPEYVNRRELHEFGGLAKRYIEFSPGHPLWERLMSHSLIAARFESKDSDSKSVLFVHAGFNPGYLDSLYSPSIRELNQAAISALKFSRSPLLLEKWINNDESPVWTRILAEAPDNILCNKILPLILNQMKVSRIVVGHTPQEDHLMKSRCNSRIILTDCAVSRWLFGDQGQPGILALSNDDDSEDFSEINAFYFNVSTQSVSSVSPQSLVK